MARLIDVDEAIINFGFEWDDIPPTREEFVRFLKKQPIIDAVPVVRCRECTGWNEKDHECSYWYGFHENDFCSYGEQKDGDGNG